MKSFLTAVYTVAAGDGGRWPYIILAAVAAVLLVVLIVTGNKKK